MKAQIPKYQDALDEFIKSEFWKSLYEAAPQGAKGWLEAEFSASISKEEPPEGEDPDYHLYADRMNEATETYARLSFTSPALLSDRGRAAASGVYKILLLGEAAAVARAMGELSLPVSCFRSSPEVLELVPPGVDQGTGLARAADRLGIPREEVIAVGDGENDIPMLRWAGLGAAMGNAPEAVKAAADIVIPPCGEDGAAWLMETYML